MKIIKLLLFFTGLFGGAALAQPYQYKFNYLTVDEGLSHTDANDIAQDGQGYMWVATYFGLVRYDGYSVRQYYNSNTPLTSAFKNRVRCICPDGNGRIWLGTEDGLQYFNARTERYTDFNDIGKKPFPFFDKLLKPAGNWLYGLAGAQLRVYHIEGDSITDQKLSPPEDLRFSDMAAGENGLIYLSGNKGLWILDKKMNFSRVALSGLPAEDLSKIGFDHRNDLLIASGDNLCLLRNDPSSGFTVVHRFTDPANRTIKNIVQDKQTGFWIATATALLRLDSSLQLTQVVDKKSSLHSLNSSSITKIFIDRSECLWVCTYAGGVNYCDLNQKMFHTLQHNPEVPGSISGNHIRSILEDGRDLWIGTTANGLNRFDLKTQTFTYFNSYNSPLRLKNDIITSLVFDNDRDLWIGSAAGIEILKPGRKELWRPPGYDKFPTYVIETLAKDCYGNIWFGNHIDRFGVIWKDKDNSFHVRYYGEGYYILPDKDKPQLFISSTHGLRRVIIDREGNITKTIQYHASADGNSLSSDYTYPVCRQNDSTYWIGTIGGGLDRLVLGQQDDKYHISSYTARYGVFTDVESLEIDNDGNIWIGGNGLECLNPGTGKLIRYDKNDGLQGNSFKVGSSYKGADGRLYFGGINGLNYFYPDRISGNPIAAQAILTGISINNQKSPSVNPDSSENSITQALNNGKELKLNYLQNNFVISFSAMHYANPLKCRYRYQLIGFDKQWKFTDGTNPSAAYSNLDFDKYRFVVEATNNDGVWSKSRAEIALDITPPWWKSPLAKLTYALLVLLGLSGIYFYQARWYRLKRELEVRAVNEQKNAEIHRQREELYQQQLTFFTNISHEFRTPLTLILGPLESLIHQNKNSVLDNSYQLMFRNAKRLINLISELMNFKKVADSVIRLQIQPVVIHQFCQDLVAEFQNLALGKDINFRMTDHTAKNNTPALTGSFDIQILEKILFNLLNNSFKYTNVGGQISFEIFSDLSGFTPSFASGFQLLNEGHRAKKYIYFLVADSGIGISADSLTKIFDRYYRISKNHLGSGVGLALVKSLTQLHKGDIYVYSERHKGTEIIIGIPLGEENYDLSEKTPYGAESVTQLEGIDNSTLLPFTDHEIDKPAPLSKISKHILLVDDNQELRSFLKQTFEKYYYIDEAEDGASAIGIASEKVPDLIISDVMMPGMNGIQLCKLVKERFETSHIPFIILSAKDALDTKIEGMESGADFYFAKPLSIDLLLLTVHNIFERSEKLKLRYTNDYLSEATELVNTEKDKEFLHKLLDLIEENIQDATMDVDFLCERLYISRTKLYQKIKSISNQSVGEFIRTIRLKKAIQIMTHEDISMHEVADRIGLQSSSNFSRAFKKEYGKSPMQFMQSLKKN